MRGAGTVVYVISCRRLGLLKIGVAEDAGKRLRELQVGSPLELTLADTRPYAERGDAVAVCEELYRCFTGRRVRGGWYRLTLEEVRHGFGRRATVEAPERARAAEAARERLVAPGQRKRLGERTEKQLAYERRRRQERTRKQKGRRDCSARG
jgi:Meiotically up-regulated gene 113